MSAAKHTPGPLIAAREDEYRTNIETKDGRVIGAAFGQWEDTPEQHQEIAANGALFAAAPDLLDALELTAFVLSGSLLICRRCKEPENTHSADRCEVAAAIAKAKGGAS